MSATPDNQAKAGKSVPDRGPERFWTVLALEIKDVESKIANKEIVQSSFGCRSDPQPISFLLCLEFGEREDDYLTFCVRSSRPVSLTKMESVLRTSSGTVLSEHERKVTKGEKLGPDERESLGYDDFYEFTPSSKGTWRLTVEIEYRNRASVENQNEAPAISTSCFEHRHSRLQEDYLSLLESAKNTDITFCFDDRQIAAHKAILSARAPYFANMFESGMKEASLNQVQIKDVEADVFKAVLQYLYSGAAPANLTNFSLELLAAADMYGLDELKKLSEPTACEVLDADNVVDAFVLADRINCASLRERAVLLLRAVIGSLDEGSAKKLKSHPELAFELAVYFSKT